MGHVLWWALLPPNQSLWPRPVGVFVPHRFTGRPEVDSYVLSVVGRESRAVADVIQNLHHKLEHKLVAAQASAVAPMPLRGALVATLCLARG